MATLMELAAELARDRVAMDKAHPPTALGLCRYCGKAWRPWKGSTIDGHVRCAVSPAFRNQLVEVLARDPRQTYKSVAMALNVTPAVVQAWWRVTKGNPYP